MKIVKINQKPQETVYTPIRSLMDDFFNFTPLNRWDDMFRGFEDLSANIWEEDNTIFVKMAMPGIKKEDIKISVSGDTLSIEGKSKEEKEEINCLIRQLADSLWSTNVYEPRREPWFVLYSSVGDFQTTVSSGVG